MIDILSQVDQLILILEQSFGSMWKVPIATPDQCFIFDNPMVSCSSFLTNGSVQESDEARKKFSNAKSISSAQYFGDQNSKDKDAQVSLQKFSGSSAISSADLFGNNDLDDSRLDLTAQDLINRISFQASQDISSLKNMAGETGKKFTSFASTFITDLQDRIL